MKRQAIGVALAATLVLAPAAGAHVTVQPESVPAGGFTRLDVRVPTERDVPTTKVEVQFPPGFLSVSSEPVPGWNIEITKRKLDKPVEQFGETVTEEVDRVIFSGGQVGPGQFQDFGLSVGVPDKPAGSALTFKAIQTYQGGEVVRWIGPPDSEEPAPQVQLTASEEEGGAAAPAEEEQQSQPPAAAEEDDDGGSDTLSIIALIVGIVALAVGLAALLSRRSGRSREATGVS
jgi:periplasmic copper chaperone A